MNSLFETDGISVDRDLLERTNPVFNAARMTLQLLTSTGHKDAGELSVAKDFSEYGTGRETKGDTGEICILENNA
ncbi:MAG: hypothetical protein K6E53_07010 [Lachnospiraceae bacterium]|nr:hypothetical protein [Lachnospiraceae bacterium]